ncbi:tripartite ATP-independent transporter DctM subunit [Roseibium hamelinense]|uniref:Tripartite ATP-independent transporter DctM subunit n=1 Tax=Roseibium hamelinense TaxID=150831 RepID=A0A562T7T1_9HYPH|nr:TRAP transporter large permease [Roseibium hamelinense]MTI43496.1 TRAP transporter large permease [Roseibium hamelinense]TWI89711.1 tripartite ATP-independent transporter DctM subunit [Roseibium hamelinense]
MGELELVGIGGLAVLFVLLALRMPVGLAMLVVGIGGTFVLSQMVSYIRFEPYLRQFKSLLWNNMANYDLSVVPLFVLMGYLASQANLSRDLFRGMNALMGRFRGGVAMSAIGACAGFGAVCGSSLATASTMGRVALPELRKLNYAPRLATGALAAGGTLGILIPPSVALVIYAVIVEASIIEMFRAAIVPGVIAVVFFITVIAVLVRLKPDLAPTQSVMEPEERRRALWRLLPVLLIFGAIILGLGIGLFTPTPAAGVGVFAILVYGFAQRLWGEPGLTLPGMRSALLDTAVTSGMIYFILFGAEVLKGFFTRAGLPSAMATWAGSSGLDPWVILIAMLIILVILGCFMESLAMILVVVPFFWPVLVDLNGGDYATAATATFGMGPEELKIWFGILALIVVELGLITPPVGLNVFIINALAKDVPMTETFRGVMPFFGVELIRVGLILGFPVLALMLPRLLSG